ncbi:PREDICTED: uncharacterized protein LOC108563351 [Nicrophorus vespilloides]|uniref:Uncharacterized protein LOC108563351 n=1 Tax=Nicrophorus vespilloides TaxID=110193 RepID=A0ABM1MSE2_NICVS|nr:PREDICTED: uncharacterized protein LOC108563351 [Nicrophorus vespilloides]
MKMNNQLFISEIKKRKSLWDLRSDVYHNRKVALKDWRDIANLFKIDVNLAKRKWKHLRDTFRVELRKNQSYITSTIETQPTCWPLYDDMEFLAPCIKQRQLKNTNIKIHTSHFVKIEEENINEQSLKDLSFIEDEANSSDSDKSSEECSTRDEDDEDLLFFKSLLPSIKKLSDKQKFLFQLEVHKSLFQFIYEK